MLTDTDKGWIKWIIIAIIIGFFVGKLISMVLGLFLDATKWALLIAACEPAAMVLALAIILAIYQKSKEKVME